MGEIRKLVRIGAALGGFLLMVGMTMVGMSALALLNVLDMSLLVDKVHIPFLLASLLLIGLLDATAAAILMRR